MRPYLLSYVMLNASYIFNLLFLIIYTHHCVYTLVSFSICQRTGFLIKQFDYESICQLKNKNL